MEDVQFPDERPLLWRHQRASFLWDGSGHGTDDTRRGSLTAHVCSQHQTHTSSDSAKMVFLEHSREVYWSRSIDTEVTRNARTTSIRFSNDDKAIVSVTCEMRTGQSLTGHWQNPSLFVCFFFFKKKRASNFSWALIPADYAWAYELRPKLSLKCLRFLFPCLPHDDAVKSEFSIKDYGYHHFIEREP